MSWTKPLGYRVLVLCAYPVAAVEAAFGHGATVMIEANYEYESCCYPTDLQTLRRQKYWSMLSGATLDGRACDRLTSTCTRSRRFGGPAYDRKR